MDMSFKSALGVVMDRDTWRAVIPRGIRKWTAMRPLKDINVGAVLLLMHGSFTLPVFSPNVISFSVPGSKSGHKNHVHLDLILSSVYLRIQM